MKSIARQKRHWGITMGVLALFFVWTTAAFAVNITVGGGGQPLDLTRYQVMHQETFEAGQDNQSFLGLDKRLKANDQWTGLLAQGAYTLTHTGKTGALRYYFRHLLDENGQPLSQYPISVEVSGDMQGQLSGAGLLYGFDPHKKHYLAFVIGSGNAYSIYQRDAEGMRRIMNGTNKAIRPNQSNQLAIVPKGAKISFYINGISVSTITDQAATSGGAGIVAISPGMFLFDNFTLYQSAGQTAPPPQQPQATRPPASPRYKAANPPARIDASAAVKKPPTKAKAPAPAPAPVAAKKSADAYQEVLKPGMSKPAVIDAFGQPTYERGNTLYYDLGAGAPGNAHTLAIKLDDNGNVLEHLAIK